MRDGSAVVRGCGDRDVHRRRAVGEPDDSVGGAAARRGFGLHLHARHSYGFVRRPGRARPCGSERAGEKDVLLAARACAKAFATESDALRKVLRFRPILLEIELRQRMQIPAGPIFGSGRGAEQEQGRLAGSVRRVRSGQGGYTILVTSERPAG